VSVKSATLTLPDSAPILAQLASRTSTFETRSGARGRPPPPSLPGEGRKKTPTLPSHTHVVVAGRVKLNSPPIGAPPLSLV